VFEILSERVHSKYILCNKFNAKILSNSHITEVKTLSFTNSLKLGRLTLSTDEDKDKVVEKTEVLYGHENILRFMLPIWFMLQILVWEQDLDFTNTNKNY
jgi:hypothetical protein